MEKPTLIIIRGNSGSGKTTVAKSLRDRLGANTMLVSQDFLRREVLRVKDGPGNPSVQLIYDTSVYGLRIGFNVIVEGILARKHYGDMLTDLAEAFNGNCLAFYFDIPFEETLRRHQSKPNCHEFGAAEMRSWWNDEDRLDYPGEESINESLSVEQVVRLILRKRTGLTLQS